jgi:hypothetical protein
MSNRAAWEQVRAQILELGIPPAVLTAYDIGTVAPILDDTDDLVRRIGRILVSEGRLDLWKLVYAEHQRGFVVHPGDEMRFLMAAMEPTDE